MLLAAHFFMSEIFFLHATFSAFKVTFYSMKLEYNKKILTFIQLNSAEAYCYYDIEAAFQLRYCSCSMCRLR